MKETYLSFRDENSNSIPECKVVEGDKVRIVGLVTNDESLWQQLNRIVIPVDYYDGRRWVRYGSFVWSGFVAVKPDINYAVLSDRLFLFSGSYRFGTITYEIGERVGGLYYKSGAFNMRFSRG